MRVPRLGLQTWLGAATVAVGLVASLVVVLVVVPTLESSLRNDRALRLSQQVERRLIDARLEFGLIRDRVEFEQSLRALAGELGGHAHSELPPFEGNSDRREVLVDRRREVVDQLSLLQPPVRVVITQEADGGRYVVGAARIDRAPGLQGTLDVAVPVRLTDGSLGIVRQRLTVAIGLVLVMASLLGFLLARLLGQRIKRLANTAAALASGNLKARAPQEGPLELRTLGDSLDRMAGRLESLVEEITHDRDRAEGLVASLTEGVLVIAPDGEVTVANDAAQRALELPRTTGVVQPGAVPEDLMDLVHEVARRGPGTVDATETTVGRRELEVRVAALKERAAGVVVTLRDVTDERRLSRARRDLVANVSHELKTPLSAIKGFQELLEDPKMDPARREQFLGLMSQEINRLERLVADQLELARLDAGEFPLEREDVDLGDLVVGVTEPRRVLAETEGVALTVHPPREGHVVVNVDPARIEQIMLILLDNALRHTPSGGRIRVSVDLQSDGAAVAVADDGEGIPDDAQPFVFDRFYQGDSSRVGRSAGLGLAIARGLAEAHGGRIELTSLVGIGSTFTLFLPGAKRVAEAVDAPTTTHSAPY